MSRELRARSREPEATWYDMFFCLPHNHLRLKTVPWGPRTRVTPLAFWLIARGSWLIAARKCGLKSQCHGTLPHTTVGKRSRLVFRILPHKPHGTSALREYEWINDIWHAYCSYRKQHKGINQIPGAGCENQTPSNGFLHIVLDNKHAPTLQVPVPQVSPADIGRWYER